MWDGDAGRLLLYGGHGIFDDSYFGDIWQYSDAQGWKKLPSRRGEPTPRSAPAVAWDDRRARLLLFGSLDGTQGQNDLWQYTVGSGRERLTPAQTPGAPPSRGLAAARWDRDSQRLLIFGESDG